MADQSSSSIQPYIDMNIFIELKANRDLVCRFRDSNFVWRDGEISYISCYQYFDFI